MGRNNSAYKQNSLLFFVVDQLESLGQQIYLNAKEKRYVMSLRAHERYLLMSLK